MITGLRLDNFRGFVTSKDLEFGKINIFYGPNSGGKSTVLRSLSLLKQSFEHNQVDHLCVLLPYSRDGVDLGSSTSLHHNLNTSVPFSISITTESRESFRLSRPQRYTFEIGNKEDSTGNVATTYQSVFDQLSKQIENQLASADATYRQIKSQPLWDRLHKERERVVFEDSGIRWTLGVTIADQGTDSSPRLQRVRFGNRHFLVHATHVATSSGRGRSAFNDWLRNMLAHYPDASDLEVLNGLADSAIRRRLTRRQVSALRRSFAALDDEFDPSGFYALEDVHFSPDYEKGLAVYFEDARDDIAGFASAVARDLEKLQPGQQQPPNEGGVNNLPFYRRLCEYFMAVSRFFGSAPDPAACVAWWKEDAKQSRVALFGFSNADYDGGDVPPLAYWLTSAWWTAWRTSAVRKTGNWHSLLVDGASQCDELHDPVSLYLSAVEAAGKSLATVRDIGPDRSSPERVYRVEPRRQAAKDYVGRQASEIPRILHDSSQLLEELNSWLAKVEIPYRLYVDPLEIRGGGGGQVRQTGLFELNAELAHNQNARINICDVGHGVFKQLALPVQVFLGRKLIITIEEPETNVHPRLQAEIADLFIEAATKRGHQIFAEAHSEILSLRLQRRIAEGQISHEDVKIFYVHAPARGPCEVLPLALDKHGTLLNEPPGGFFDEWLREV